MLSLLNDVFHEGDDVGDRDKAFQLSTGAKHEMLLLAIWAPYAFANLRAQPLDQLFCSDASLSGGGVCSAQCSKAAVLEFCRVSEQKGFYTRINGSTLGRYIAQHTNNIVEPPEIAEAMSEGYLWDFVEIYRGSGHLSQAHRNDGLRVHPGFDIQRGFNILVKLLDVYHIHFGNLGAEWKWIPR